MNNHSVHEIDLDQFFPVTDRQNACLELLSDELDDLGDAEIFERSL